MRSLGEGGTEERRAVEVEIMPSSVGGKHRPFRDQRAERDARKEGRKGGGERLLIKTEYKSEPAAAVRSLPFFPTAENGEIPISYIFVLPYNPSDMRLVRVINHLCGPIKTSYTKVINQM